MIFGKEIILRPVESDDISFLCQWENDPEFWAVSDNTGPVGRSELEEFIDRSNDLQTYNQIRWIILDEDREPIGAIDIFDFHPETRTAAIGILIANSIDRGKGYGSDALETLINYYKKNQTITTLRSLIFTDNYPSLALFKKNGFKEIAPSIFKGKAAIQFILEI